MAQPGDSRGLDAMVHSARARACRFAMTRCHRALRRVLDLCRRAAAAVDDRYGRDKLRLVEDFAAELLSHSEHGKWDRESMSGAQFLKQQILGALELYHSRLYSLEALRRSAARASLTNVELLRT